MKDDVLVSVRGVDFSYNGERVLEGINLAVRRGEFLGIIGPNGSGKTTLLKLILGLLKPETGSVELFGQSTGEFAGWAKIGYVPQRAGTSAMQFPLTVYEVAAMGRVKAGLVDFSTKADGEAVIEALKEVDMYSLRNRLIGEISGGQLQRVFIARALASKPELLVLDEPTVGVDGGSQTKFYQLLRDLHKKSKLTLILISHDVDVVAHEVTEIACLNRRLVFHGKPHDVLKSDFVEKLYGKDLRLIVHGH